MLEYDSSKWLRMLCQLEGSVLNRNTIPQVRAGARPRPRPRVRVRARCPGPGEFPNGKRAGG